MSDKPKLIQELDITILGASTSTAAPTPKSLSIEEIDKPEPPSYVVTPLKHAYAVIQYYRNLPEFKTVSVHKTYPEAAEAFRLLHFDPDLVRARFEWTRDKLLRWNNRRDHP